MSFSNVAISPGTLSPKTTMENLNFKFVARKILGYKPTHHILTEALGVPVSCGLKKKH
jgi:hypothetical protein